MERKKTSTDDGSIATLTELCLMHGDDPTLHLRLADSLWNAGREIAALATARKVYQVLKQKNPAEAGLVAERFGEEITVDEKYPPTTQIYSPLQEVFKKSLKKYAISIAKGDILFHMGDAADLIYLVLEGEVALSAEVDGNYALVNYLYSGCLVGKDVRDKAGVYKTTAVATKNTVVLPFTEKLLKKAFDKHPDLEIQFAKDMMLRSRVELLSSIQSLSRAPMGLRFLLAKRSWDVTYAAGDIVKGAHKSMPYVSFVLSGVLHLYDEQEGEEPLYCGRMTSRDILGLNALMHKEVKSLVIKAETDCVMLCLSFRDVEDLMDLQPRVRKKLTDTAIVFSQQVTRTILLQKKMNI